MQTGEVKRLAKYLQKAIQKRKIALINFLLTSDEQNFKSHELEQLTLSEIEEMVKKTSKTKISP